MPYERIVYHPSIKELNDDVALLLGLHAGNGWLSDKWGISCGQNHKEILVRIMELVRNILGVEPNRPVKFSSDRAVMIRSGQPQALAFFRDYDFPQGRKAGTVGIPKQIIGSKDKEIIKAFLCGLFSTNGCFSFQINHEPREEIQVKSKELRDGFADLTGRIGFEFRTNEYLPPKGKNKSPLQVAYTTLSQQVIRWMEEVVSIKDGHVTRYVKWKMLNDRSRLF